MGAETDSGPSKVVADKNLVRTDAREQKLDKFVTATPRARQVQVALCVEQRVVTLSRLISCQVDIDIVNV